MAAAPDDGNIRNALAPVLRTNGKIQVDEFPNELAGDLRPRGNKLAKAAPSDRHDPAPLSAPLDDRSGLVEGPLLMVRAQSSQALA